MIEDLTTARSEREPELAYRTQRRVNMDKMNGMYIPFDCRDQMWYMIKKRTWRYIVYTLDPEDLFSIVIERCGLRDAPHEDFLEAVPDNRAAWIAIDLPVSPKLDKVIFITWVPEGCTREGRTTMTFKSKFFKAKIVEKTGFNANFPEVKAHTKADLELNALLKKI